MIVAGWDHLSGLFARHSKPLKEVEFVDDQQVLADQELLQTLQPPFVGSFNGAHLTDNWARHQAALAVMIRE